MVLCVAFITTYSMFVSDLNPSDPCDSRDSKKKVTHSVVGIVESIGIVKTLCS